MNPSQKRSSVPASDATSASAPSKKPKILTTPSGIALPQQVWFDPWSSSSTGHQRAENNLAGSTSWRDSRNLKLGAQYKGGRGGGKRVADTVGAGSEDFGKDRQKVNGSWRDGVKGLRDKTQRNIHEATVEAKRDWAPSTNEEISNEEINSLDNEDEELRMAIAASLKDTGLAKSAPPNKDEDLERAIAASIRDHATPSHSQADSSTIPPSNQADYYDSQKPPADESGGEENEDMTGEPKQVFRNLVFYINGSTAPLISDHKLKFLISSHGGSLSISHARKQVTHVIIGNPHNHLSSTSKGAGGALAGTKMQKEIARTRGKGVKFVGAQWVIDSVKAGKRMGEASYKNVKLGGAGQGSVFDKFKVGKPGIGNKSAVAKSGERIDEVTDEELGIWRGDCFDEVYEH